MGAPASKSEAKKVYRQEAMKHHPDRGGDVEKMKKVNVEWEQFQKSREFEKLAMAFLDELRKIMAR